MRSSRPLAATLALLLLTTFLPSQGLQISVSSPTGSTGLVCAPVTCTPGPLTAMRGQSLQFVSMGATYRPHVLLLALPPAQCVQSPVFSGSLIVQGPILAVPLPMSFGRIYTTGPGPACSGWMGFGSLRIPQTAPPGVVLVMQMASIVTGPGGSQVGLSNAASVTIS